MITCIPLNGAWGSPFPSSARTFLTISDAHQNTTLLAIDISSMITKSFPCMFFLHHFFVCSLVFSIHLLDCADRLSPAQECTVTPPILDAEIPVMPHKASC